MNEEYKDLVMGIESLLDATKSVRGYYLTKTLVVGKKQLNILRDGYVEFDVTVQTDVYRGLPVKLVEKDSHLTIEIGFIRD